MTPKTLFTSLLAAAALTFAVGAQRSSATEILQNGGFETAGATTTGAADWTLLPGIAPGTIATGTRTTDPTNAHSGSNYMLMSVTGLNGVGGGNSQVLNSTPIGSVTPGTTYTLSLYAKGALQTSDVYNFSMNFFNAAGSSLGGVATGNSGAISSTYTNFTKTDVAPAGASYAQVDLNLVAGAVTNTSPGTLSVDDVSVSSPGGTIPEPATLALLGIGGVALLRRKRVAC